MAGFVEWLPIEDLPEALKDGRDVLFWVDRWGHGVLEAMIVHYDKQFTHAWLGPDGEIDHVTHFAEINAPGWIAPPGYVKVGGVE